MVTLDRDRDRPSEEDVVRAVPDGEVRERISRVGIGEYVGAGQHIADRLALGAQSHPLGYALVRGAVDWRRAGVTRAVPASLLPALAAAHLTPRQRISLADQERYADALGWATREVNPTVALLEPGDGVFTVYDFALDLLTASNDELPVETWQLVMDNAEPEELLAVGYQAELTYGHHDVAQRAWRRAADAGDTRAMSNLGVLLMQCGDLTEAETWYRRAADAGDTAAM
jgi:TPR repeat protein